MRRGAEKRPLRKTEGGPHPSYRIPQAPAVNEGFIMDPLLFILFHMR